MGIGKKETNYDNMINFVHITGGGQELHTSSLVLPVADNIFK